MTQAGGVPARLACMPVMDSMIEFGGEFINSSQPIRKQHTEAASPPAPAVAPARGAATAAPERALAQAPLLGSVLSVGGSRTPVGFLARPASSARSTKAQTPQNLRERRRVKGRNAFRQAERTDRRGRSGVRSEFDTPRAQGAPSRSSWRNRRSRPVAPRGQRRLGATGPSAFVRSRS